MKLETVPICECVGHCFFNGLQAKKSEEYRTDATGVADLLKRIKKTFQYVSTWETNQLFRCFVRALPFHTHVRGWE